MDNEEYLKEVNNALARDETLLGRVWKHTYPVEKSPDEISKELDKATSGFVYNYRRYLGAMLNGEIPDKPTLAKQTERALRSFQKRHRGVLSNGTEQELKLREEKCASIANNPEEVERENADIEIESIRRIGEFEKANVPGIYLYTYPRYLSAPIEPSNDDSTMRTFMKIGISEKNARERIRQQTTGMPEPPKIIEIWVVNNDDDVKLLESKIKHHLNTIGHGRSGTRRREWFLTNEETVVSTIDLIGLTRFADHVKETSANVKNVGE